MQTLKKIALSLAFLPLIATAQEIDADKRMAIDELLNVTKSDKQVQAMSDGGVNLSKQESPFILEKTLVDNKTLSDAKKRAAVEKLKKGSVQKLQDQAGKVFATDAFRSDAKKAFYDSYAKNFSAQELRDIVMFFKTPSGQKYLATWDIAQQDIGGAVMPKYLQMARKSTHDLAEKEIAAAAK